MNPVIASLLELQERDPLPPTHASSFWQDWGRRALVERRDGGLVLRGSGFGSVQAGGWPARLLRIMERVSYKRVTAQLAAYGAVWQTARRLARDLDFDLTFDVWRQAVTLAVLEDHLAHPALEPRTFAVIGDGWGFLGALIRRHRPSSVVYCIDLPKILLFQARTHERAGGGADMALLGAEGCPGSRVIFVTPDDVERIDGVIDCGVNIASMQEMRPASIEGYFRFLRARSTPRSRFYCVNRAEKRLPDGEVIRFENYPWFPDDEIFLGGPCPYYTHFLSSRTLPAGPRILGVRVPFVNSPDGVVLHRLVRLAPTANGGAT